MSERYIMKGSNIILDNQRKLYLYNIKECCKQLNLLDDQIKKLEMELSVEKTSHMGD